MTRDILFLQHILESIEFVLGWTKGKTFDEFQQDHMLLSAVVRKLEIIGEASARISVEFRDAQKDIPWGEMKAMRNKLIHEYERVNLRTIWLTVEQDLPLLHASITKFLSTVDKPSQEH